MVTKVFVLVFIGLIAFNVIAAEDKLECYQCTNCEKEKDAGVCTKDDLADENTQTTPDGTTGETTLDGTTPDGATGGTTLDGTTQAATTQAATTQATARQQRDDTTSGTESPKQEYSCYTVKDKENQINRGCTKKVGSCDEIKVADLTCVKVCDTNQCNTATSIQSLAFSTIIFVAITKMLLH